MKQLDALRAFAVFGVLWAHWVVRNDEPFMRIEWGHLGVQLFFVLSGFLITGILLDCRTLVEQNRTTRLYAIGRFYVRRFLRIFPLFYMTLFVTTLSNFPTLRAGVGWHAAYLSNVYFFHLGNLRSPANHFWSLAVEEQFYFVWPWLIIFLPSRWLLPFIISAIISAPLFQLGCRAYFPGVALVGILTPSCLDSLGIGGLLAYLVRNDAKGKWSGNKVANLFLAVGLPVWILIIILSNFNKENLILTVLEQPFLALSFGWLVFRSASGWDGWTGKFLQFRPLAYLGRISYGLYIFHNFVPLGLKKVAKILSFPESLSSLPFSFFLYSFVTVALAAISWHFYEKPLNDLKQRFPYKAHQEKTT